MRGNSNPVGTILFAFILIGFKLVSWMVSVLYEAATALAHRLAHGSR